MTDIADFLRRHPPFDTLDEETLARVAASAEAESHAAPAAILEHASATSGTPMSCGSGRSSC